METCYDGRCGTQLPVFAVCLMLEEGLLGGGQDLGPAIIRVPLAPFFWHSRQGPF